MSDELNLENLDAVPAEEPVVEASEAAADEAAAPVEPVADLSAESDASVDNADVESDAPAATESAPVASTQTETVSLDEDEEEVNESEQAEETDAGQQAVDEFSKSLRSLDGKWYVLHTYSGYERRVATDIMARAENFEVEDYIFDATVPMETVIEIKNGNKKKEVSRVRIPGLVVAVATRGGGVPGVLPHRQAFGGGTGERRGQGRMYYSISTAGIAARLEHRVLVAEILNLDAQHELHAVEVLL